MEKEIRFKFKGGSKIRRIGNSLGITIPKGVLETLNLKEGNDVPLYVSEDNNALVIFNPKGTAPKGENWERTSFELSLPKELAERLLGD